MMIDVEVIAMETGMVIDHQGLIEEMVMIGVTVVMNEEITTKEEIIINNGMVEVETAMIDEMIGIIMEGRSGYMKVCLAY